ncbi:MAG: hypothetical protein IS632_01970 [Thaumarchaeota archaeon]|nr:hypothetical protein [Nitrososphaerota archaeon]
MNKREKYTIAAFLVALIAVTAWRAMPNPPKVHVGGNRIHHGLVGAALFVTGALAKRWDVAVAGVVLATDDIDDISQWLDFKERGSTELGAVRYPNAV